jgi:hypothetical protein
VKDTGSTGTSQKEIRPVLSITIPEMFNVALRANDALINLNKKILGDLSLECKTGDILIFSPYLLLIRF